MSAKRARPPHYPYTLQALRDIPRRIFRPPKPDAPRQRVGRVRQLTLTPVYEVKLEDVLHGKHLPPLGLPEFELYLAYTERSAENLYFTLWFRNYTKQYNDWTRSSTYPAHSPTLAYAYSRAKQSFFTPSAPLELNLPADAITALNAANPSRHPPPSSFADITHHVEIMLTGSLHNFVRSMSANAGRNRGLFAIFVGLSVMCLGLAPILVSALRGRSRWLRFAALPCFWFGATTLICGLHGVCIVIFLFGDARQLMTYELVRPKISHKRHSRSNFPSTSHTGLTSSRRASSEQMELTLPKPAMTPDLPRFCFPELATNDNAVESRSPLEIQISPCHDVDEKFATVSLSASRPPSPMAPVTIAPFLSMSTLPSSANQHFDFDNIVSPPPSAVHLSHSPPVFGPLTEALDLIAIRTYWETVVRSAGFALVVAFILVGIAVGVSA